ncbi:glycosyl hydrolase 2 galactose-binding domain-containing protein [Paraburkholderia bannensis]|uniref:glycosyl hydrolase 2 galactose-binding domain-containing protein n=1 Tax=Paraburkholderia bannensis TaxID=765414 RepID=UPI002ABDBAE3|nr:glycoside hydrolase family 2 protein [Paraburkholderia bannensis]
MPQGAPASVPACLQAGDDLWPAPLDAQWRCVSTRAGACDLPSALDACTNAADWLDAPVPGTVASALRAAGKLDIEHAPPLASQDHWYRTTLDGAGTRRLRLHGLASIAEVWLDDTLLLDSASMFVAHDLEFELHGTATLALCFRSLDAALGARRTRARWRPRLVSPPALRNVRTTLLGHMPGWCPSVHAAGPWRPIEVLGDAPDAFDHADIATTMDGDDGIVDVTLRFVNAHDGTQPATLHCSGAKVSLAWQDAQTLRGTLRVPKVERWWPHTHGTPTRHALTLRLAQREIALGEMGFRSLEVDRGADGAGFALRINGTPVFCRGACWTSADLVTLAGSEAQLEHTFALARDAGMNIIRVGGTMVYESDAFYRLADAYGVLVWQDFAFANFDYPTDAAFTAEVETEATQFLARTRRYAALAVVCGGSEADQQGAMFGLPPEMREQALFTQQLPAIVARERPDVAYVTNSPSGGTWPFSTRTGVTHYYGVSAYQRPLDDVRRSQVRFASECLAFANVPDDATLHDALGTIHAHDPRWKNAVPRDPGAGWDFDDVRDHYVRTLFGVEPSSVRYEDPQRYLDLSRAVVAELMIDVFSEWRRAGSSCGGGLVWQLQDLRAGAGWGVIDACGRPKSAWHALAQVLNPVQAVITDEGLNGLDIHLVNERDQALALQLELVCLRDGAVSVVQASRAVELAPRSVQRVSAADLLGRFFDFTHAYRFGPRTHDVTLVTLRDPASGAVISEAFHLPERRVLERHDLGIVATPQRAAHGWQLVVEARRFARGVHIADAHYRACRDWFPLAPGRPVTIDLLPLDANADIDARAPDGEVRAINASAATFYR